MGQKAKLHQARFGDGFHAEVDLSLYTTEPCKNSDRNPVSLASRNRERTDRCREGQPVSSM